jgi:hypothetical protein
MPISKERFAQGLTGQQFIDLIEKNRERFEQNLKETTAIFTDEDRAFFAEHPVSIAAIAEDWCTDVVQFLPPIIKLAEEVPSITLRIFLRDQNLDLMDQYLKEGKFRSVPTFIIYDADWNELGHFNERPAAVTQEMAKETRRFEHDNSELEGINRTVDNMPPETYAAVRANSAKFRWDSMLAWNRMFLEEIKSIAAGATVRA